MSDCRDVYEFLDHNVRPRPTMWARGDSLQELAILLYGYGVAVQVHSVPEDFAFGSDGHFEHWLQKEYGWGMARGWATAIEDNLDEGETAMDAFFRLLDEYRAIVGAQQSRQFQSPVSESTRPRL